MEVPPDPTGLGDEIRLATAIHEKNNDVGDARSGSPAMTGSEGSETRSVTVNRVTKKGAWLAAVQQGQKGLKKYDVAVTLNDGVGSVEVPDEVFQDPSPLWEDFLIGKFLEKSPHIAKVHAIVNKIWALGDKSQMIEVFPINATTMKFCICKSVLQNRVLRRGMWNLAEVPVVMVKWSPFPEESQPAMKSIPLWVHMKNIPVTMFSWKGLSFAASPVGVLSRLHPETAQCLNMKVAKIFVNADLTKELPRALNFNFHGKETLVEFTYPWLPSRCFNCQKWGHLAKSCLGEKRLTLEKQNEEEKETVGLEGNSLDLDESKKLQSVENNVSPKAGEGNITETENSVKDTVEADDAVSDENNKQVEEHAWSTPMKSCRSPDKAKTLEYGQVSILSNSRFAVLSPTEEEGEISEQN
ncbi:hypothetical protein N665_0057s0045 [Sinapis alba]|nr:hypothetical protein N665_0057s0045 [Sinapis alba]